MSPTVQKFHNFRLDRLSLPPRRSCHFSDRVELATGRIGASQWVLSRALCRFNRFDLTRLPVSKRKAALALQLPQWSPYAESAYAIAWQNGFASVWCWDNARIDAEIKKHGKTPKSQRKIPETLLRAPLPAGLRLLKCLDGVEGQYWQDAQLIASRWWPQRPDEQAWLSFQRDCGIAPEQQEGNSTLQDVPLQLRPWIKIATPSGATDDMPLAEIALYGALTLGLGVTTVVLAMQHYQIDRAIAQRSSELAAIKGKAGSVFAARESALSALTRLKSIETIEPYPQPLVLMAALAETLPKDSGAFVREWDMSGNRLKVAVKSPDANIAGADYEQALEKTGRFGDIQIITDADPKTTGFSMTIRPLDPAAVQERAK
jgi:hypothetical protein